LKSTISLLEQTSILIANCRDRRPIREVGDIRLMENDKVLNWFCEWESINKIFPIYEMAIKFQMSFI
jgi:hypothetical protein